ncbi:helix-turn-helix transcriptional regulator [Pseudomonas leptonychotis]|uniref:Helix-turn-helix transcriptional regulator n=1 Tax=Pseudomonas leptonychotis TaxID=2448482 RepID=A0A4T1ZYH1_9PSED|nr:LuxR C-terminal-related transcriptional regulator [Pseudomonas leptonychotis]TIH09650.1 helix-turn-helix transcriptional regulator [Pseudomonas leptonychotis]
MNASAPFPPIVAVSSCGNIQRPPPGHIPRLTLQQRLLAPDCRLRLLIGPAGFGKTVLLADCARECPLQCGLLWLNCAGNGLNADQLAQQLGRLLDYPAQLTADEVLLALAQETRQLWIMLNDYPVRPDSTLDEYLNQLLSVTPAGVCWWLGSRRRPNCNLSRLLLEGELLELGATDLAFTAAEVADWLHHLDPTRSAWARELHESTLGWPAALRLRLLAAQAEPAEANAPLDCGHDHLLGEYVAREVLQDLPAELLQMLYSLAQLPRFNPALCDHLFGVGEGADWLRGLIERGLFIQEVEPGKGWFVLFAPLAALLQRLTAGVPYSALHVHASQWFASQGDIRAAVEHALLAGQPEVAGSFLERFTEEQVLQGQDLALILRWRSELPESLLCSTPRLILLNAWVLLLVGRLDEAELCIDQLARFQPRSDGARTRELFAHWQAIQGIIAYGRVCAIGARSNLLEALQGLPQSAWSQSLLCRSALTLVAIGEGDLELAHKLSFEALKQARLHDNPVFEALLELDHALLLEARGEFVRAEALLQRVLNANRPEVLRGTPVLARLQLRLARVQLRQGRHTEAASGLPEGLANALECGDPGAFNGYLCLAELAMGQGDLAGAFAHLGKAERLMQRQHVSETLYRGTLLLASSHLWVAQGHHARARMAIGRVLGYAQRVKAILPTPNFPELIPRLQLLLLQMELAQGRDVREPLLQLREQALSQGRQALVSELYLVYAEASAACGDQTAAAQARETGHALRRRLAYHCLWFSVAQPVTPAAAAQRAATNTLSQRELAVLRLIAQGCSNQEVAEQLFISLHTVKTHARRINGKLGVSRRTQAVAKAKALGFF